MNRLCSNESPSAHKIINDLDYNDSIDRLNRIVDFYSMSQLLQPKHKYFADKQACIVDFESYKEPEHKKKLVYAKLSGKNGQRMPRKNPYRRKQLAGSHTARRIKMILELIKKFALSGFKCAFMTLTMPKEISVWLSYQKNGTDMAWRMFNNFWEWYDSRFGQGLAASVNLHTWRSEVPLEPHYHFHGLIPNYKKMEIDIKDEDDNNGYYFEMQEWHKQRGGTHVPVSESDLLEIKMAWWKILVKVCQRNKIDWWGTKSSEYAEKLDIHFAYAAWFNIIGKIKLMHWFNYQGRSPLQDYAKYSNKHLDCPNPPGWLENYENHSRAFGWWKEIRKLAPVSKEEKVKINPVTGNRMEYMGRWTIYELMKEGNLGFLEVIRGNPIFHRLRGYELAWLLSVQKNLHPGLERDKMYDYQAGEMEET